MKILFISDSFAPAWAFGGPPKVLWEISKELVNNNNEVTVYTSNIIDINNYIYEKKRIMEKIEVFYFSTISFILSWNFKIFIPTRFYRLVPLVKNSDIIILSEFRTINNALGYILSYIYNKPCVIMAFGSLPRGSGYKKYLKLFYDILIGNTMIKNACKLIAQNNHEMYQYYHHGANTSNVIRLNLWVNLDEFTDLPPKRIFIEKYSLDERCKIILFLGRIHYSKGLDLVLDIFNKLCKTRDDVILVIVGRDDGYLKEMLHKISEFNLEEKIHYLGPIYDKERIEAYTAADIFVLTSRAYEETSLASLEACASNTPVILTKQAADYNIIKYGAGTIINFDEKQLMNALTRLLDDEQLRCEMGIKSRKMVEEVFSVSKVVINFETVLKDCVYNGFN